MEEIAQLKAAIDTDDLAQVQALMQRNPELHRAPLGYGNDGPLTWVAECRIPWQPPSPARLAMAKWMMENGSDVHQGGDGPLMRAALNADRIPMMELLVQHGADVNASWHGGFPIIQSPCETVDPAALEWLLAHGADPNRNKSALDYLIGSYIRAPKKLAACIDLLLQQGAATKYTNSAVLAILRNQLEVLENEVTSDAALVHYRFDDLDFGTTGGRMLTLKGSTLLHVAAEFGNLKAAELLRARGADVNARATIDADGVGGQTPIFHCATQFWDTGLPLTEWLLDEGADLSIRCKLPGHYEHPGQVVECTLLAYARLFPGDENETVALLEARSAPQ